VLGVNMHGFGSTIGIAPSGVPVNTKPTVPIGALGMPASVSITVTPQVTGTPAVVDSGQFRVVEVEHKPVRPVPSISSRRAVEGPGS
jgi:hypothetical protein